MGYAQNKLDRGPRRTIAGSLCRSMQELESADHTFQEQITAWMVRRASRTRRGALTHRSILALASRSIKHQDAWLGFPGCGSIPRLRENDSDRISGNSGLGEGLQGCTGTLTVSQGAQLPAHGGSGYGGIASEEQESQSRLVGGPPGCGSSSRLSGWARSKVVYQSEVKRWTRVLFLSHQNMSWSLAIQLETRGAMLMLFSGLRLSGTRHGLLGSFYSPSSVECQSSECGG